MSELYEIVSLSDVVKINSGIALPKIFKDKKFTNGEYQFYKVAQMNNDSHIMKDAELNFSKGEAKEFKIKIFPKGSVLVPKRGGAILTNKKRLLIEDASYDSNIMGLKADNNFLSDEFLVAYMNLINLADYIDTSTIPQINNKHIEMMKIPLPPLQEQKRIVAKLDALFTKIDQAVILHQQNIDEADKFMGSVLNDVFVELEEKHKKIPLFEVANVARGKSKHRPRNDNKLFGGKYPFVQTGDVRNANKYIQSYTNTYNEFGLQQSKLWDKGTICMTIAANIGDVAILGIDACFPDSVVGIYSSNNSNDFIFYFLLTLKQQLESQATTTAQMNINLKVLQTIGVSLPPLKTQQKTVTYLDQLSQKTEILKQVQKEKLENLKALKASILDKAFRGEL